jgi:hypothetical protein
MRSKTFEALGINKEHGSSVKKKGLLFIEMETGRYLSVSDEKLFQN